MDEFFLDCCFNSGYECLKLRESTSFYVAKRGVDKFELKNNKFHF
jgi:hypothetical protein